MIFKCPGSQNFSQPRPELQRCPYCGEEVEIWTDEVKSTCPLCKKEVFREVEMGCLEWCKYAKECVGEETLERYFKNRALTLRDKLLKELETFFGKDTKRINHAKKVMKFAEELLKREKGSWHIVIPASILHDIGIKVSEKKYGSPDAYYQQKEGPAIARDILKKYGLKEADIDEICEIIAHHHTPGVIDTINFKLLYDADWLVNLKDEVDINDKTAIKKAIDKIFLTEAGKELAKKHYL